MASETAKKALEAAKIIVKGGATASELAAHVSHDFDTKLAQTCSAFIRGTLKTTFNLARAGFRKLKKEVGVKGMILGGLVAAFAAAATVVAAPLPLVPLIQTTLLGALATKFGEETIKAVKEHRANKKAAAPKH